MTTPQRPTGHRPAVQRRPGPRPLPPAAALLAALLLAATAGARFGPQLARAADETPAAPATEPAASPATAPTTEPTTAPTTIPATAGIGTAEPPHPAAGPDHVVTPAVPPAGHEATPAPAAVVHAPPPAAGHPVPAVTPAGGQETTTTAHPGGGEAHPGGEAHAGGEHVEGDNRLLQLPPSKDTALSALWVLIIFVVLLIILYPTAWKNVLVGLKKREERIRTDIAEAEAARGRAEKTLAEYNARLATAEQKVRDMIQEATVQAQQIADGIRTRAQQDAQEAKEKATADIERARADAVAQIYEQAATLATAVAERVLPRTLSAEDQQALVNRSLDEISKMGGPRAA